VSWEYQSAIEYVIALLNADILRELRMADECIQRAGSVARQYLPFRHLIAQCAASALSNASALAAEVLSLGGNPCFYAPGPVERAGAATSIEAYLAQAASLLAHYQDRLAMAERLGLTRLREVLQEIVASKRRHLNHAVLVAATGNKPKQLG
jgi:bacterioferritin (cytochrome b1)